MAIEDKIGRMGYVRKFIEKIEKASPEDFALQLIELRRNRTFADEKSLGEFIKAIIERKGQDFGSECYKILKTKSNDQKLLEIFQKQL